MRRVRRRKWRGREVLGGRVNIYSPYRILQRSVTSSSIVFDQISDTASRKEATGPIPPLPLFTRWAHACSYRLPFYMHPCGSGEGLRRNDTTCVGSSTQCKFALRPKKANGFSVLRALRSPAHFQIRNDHLVDRKVSGRSVCSSEVAVRGPFKRQVGINFHASQ